MDTVAIMVASNNDNGRFMEWADAVEIEGPDDTRIYLEMGDPVPFELDRTHMRLRFGCEWDDEEDEDGEGDLLPVDAPWFDYTRERRHVGNIVWNAYHMAPTSALALLERLRADGWGCTEAATETFHKWRNPAVLLDLTDLGLEVPEMLPGRDYPDPYTLNLFA